MLELKQFGVTMRKMFLIMGILLFTSMLSAQTISTHSWKNGVKELAPIPEGMTYEEFLKLQREISWQRIFASALIPGYLHFYASHEKEGWYIVVTRSIGMGLMLYGLLDEVNYVNTLNFFSAIAQKDEVEDRSQRNFILFLAGFGINALAFSFDWAHADWVISKERNEILYKYGIKMRGEVAPDVSFLNGGLIPGVKVKIRF
jgi:hypothetical protein